MVCQLWEAAAAPAAAGGVRVTFARSGMVLAPDGGAMAKLLPLFRLGLGGRLGTGSQWWSWISLDDEVEALVWLLEHDVAGPVNLTSPNPATNQEFTTTLARALARPAWLAVPRFGPRLLLGHRAGRQPAFHQRQGPSRRTRSAGLRVQRPSARRRDTPHAPTAAIDVTDF